MKEAILLVEDDPFLREGLCELLNREGYAVIAAATATEGAVFLAGGNPALIILDIGLPEDRKSVV